jgi:hypothetical protein
MTQASKKSSLHAKNYKMKLYSFEQQLNKLFEWLFSRVLASHCGGSGLISVRDMSVSGPQV